MTKKWFIVREAAGYFDLNTKTLYSLISRGLIPSGCVKRFGKQIRLSIERMENEERGTTNASARE